MHFPSRRSFLTTLAAAPILAPQTARRPNILFAIADDWGWPFAALAGDPVVKTPVFDRLAAKGVLFTNAFASAPSCSPSRAAILTGQWHWRLEEGGNLAGVLPSKFPVFPDLLEKAGYHVGFTRKGWAPGNETGGGRTRNPAGPRFEDFNSFMSARPKAAPFCFWFGSTDPHRKYDVDSGVKSGMRPESVKLPPWLPDSDVVRRDLCDYYLEIQRFDREVGEILSKIEQIGEAENTLVVVTADNGCPFPRAKATLYEAGTHVPLAIHWPGKAEGGRKVDDLVSLSDMAPTFLEAAGLRPPGEMTARSLLPLIQSGKDISRNYVLTGMERHVPSRGPNRGGYPMRAIRTHDFLYIRNFHPERWPAGDPNGFEKPGAQPFTYAQMEDRTQHAFADIDAGPTKAWMVQHRHEPDVRRLYQLAVGKRPEHELFHLRTDPFAMKNVASESAYARDLQSLQQRLMAELKQTGDPRAHGRGEIFESYAYGGRS